MVSKGCHKKECDSQITEEQTHVCQLSGKKSDGEDVSGQHKKGGDHYIGDSGPKQAGKLAPPDRVRHYASPLTPPGFGIRLLRTSSRSRARCPPR
jgi:hypothetical protein